jgi:hypothetical protein
MITGTSYGEETSIPLKRFIDILWENTPTQNLSWIFGKHAIFQYKNSLHASFFITD